MLEEQSMKTIIHVNGHNIRANKTDGQRRPVFTVKDWKQNRIGNFVKMLGPGVLVYKEEKGQHRHHGAAAWIETLDPVEVHDEEPQT